MHEKVVHEFLNPSVEHGDEAELAFKAPLRITGKELQGLFTLSEGKVPAACRVAVKVLIWLDEYLYPQEP